MGIKQRKTGGKDFQPGNPGGPGRPALPAPIKALQKLNHAGITMVVSQLQGLPIEEIVRIAKDPKTPALQAAFASVLAHAIKEGDMNRLDKLLDRGAGRVKQIVQVERQVIDNFEFTEEGNDED